MRLASTLAQTLEPLALPQYLAPLLGQGGELRGEFLLSRHTHLQHLCSVLLRGHTAEGRQTQGDASRILGLTPAMLLGYALGDRDSPTYAMSDSVRKITANTSRDMRKHFLWIKKISWRNEFWSVGFFSSTIGVNEDVIKRYVEFQEKVSTGKVQLDFGF